MIISLMESNLQNATDIRSEFQAVEDKIRKMPSSPRELTTDHLIEMAGMIHAKYNCRGNSGAKIDRLSYDKQMSFIKSISHKEEVMFI